jgi:hypothetical protein
MFESMHEIYRYYPLHDIVSSLLKPTICYKEIIWFELENRVNEDLDRFDIDLLDLFFDTLASNLDLYMECMIPGYDHVDFDTVRWLDSTTVIIRETPWEG